MVSAALDLQWFITFQSAHRLSSASAATLIVRQAVYNGSLATNYIKLFIRGALYLRCEGVVMDVGRSSTRGWLVKCTTCGTKWVLEVSFDLRESKLIYHYCKVCGKNTFHEVLGRAEKMNVE